jgi:hypothetical protein
MPGNHQKYRPLPARGCFGRWWLTAAPARRLLCLCGYKDGYPGIRDTQKAQRYGTAGIATGGHQYIQLFFAFFQKIAHHPAHKRAPKSLNANDGPWKSSSTCTLSSSFTTGAGKLMASSINAFRSASGIESPSRFCATLKAISGRDIYQGY